MNFFSPFSRRERESDFLVSRFERRKRNYKKYSPLSRREREMDFLFSRFEKRTRNFKKHSPLSRREREIDFLFSRFEKRARNSKKDSPLSRRERDFIFERRTRNFYWSPQFQEEKLISKKFHIETRYSFSKKIAPPGFLKSFPNLIILCQPKLQKK